MRNDMLFIDGELVDLDDSTKITLNYKSNIFTDLSKIVSNNSYTIKLPKTVRNQKIILHADLPASEGGYARKYHDARYFRNGVEIIPKAKAVLISVSDSIEVAMTWGNFTELAPIIEGGKSLRDLKEGDYVGSIYYPKYVEWKDWGKNDLVFPKVDYGFKNGDKEVWYHPVKSLKDILRYIQDDNNIEFKFSEEKADVLEKIFIPLLTKNASEKYAEIESVTAEVVGIANDRVDKICLSLKEKSGGSYYGRLNSVGGGTIANYFNSYESNVSNAVPKLSGEIDVVISSNIEPISACIEVYNYNFNGNGSELDSSTVLEILALYITKLEDGKYKVNFNFENEQTNLLSTLYSSTPYIKFALKNMGQVKDIISVSGIIKIVNIEQEIVIGGRFWVIPNLPDIKQIDFLKVIITLMGVFPVYSEVNGFQFMPVDSIIENKKKAYDWTRKLIASYKENKPRTISYSLDDFARKNNYRWKEDDTVIGNYDGYLVVEDETIEADRDAVKIPFAASNQFSDVAKIPIYSYDEAGKLKYNSVEPRILAYNGVKGVFMKLDWNTILATNYQKYQSFIRKPVVIMENIEISDIELKNIDMTVPVYLAQYGRYYAIISVKAEDTGICECKLLQLEV